MEIEKPSSNAFTIYSKSGCINCRKVKDFLKNNKQEYIEINCDEYLLEDKVYFLSFIENYSKCEWKVFPMVFHKEEFIGGYEETKLYVEKLLAFNFDNDL
jgi:glutaredoxin